MHDIMTQFVIDAGWPLSVRDIAVLDRSGNTLALCPSSKQALALMALANAGAVAATREMAELSDRDATLRMWAGEP